MPAAKNEETSEHSSVMNVNLNETETGIGSANTRKAISAKLLLDIDAWSVSEYSKPYKKRLGGSMLGTSCWQKLWLTFRWCKAEKRDGRMYRLLDRGNREEPYTFKMLTGAGFRLFTHDPATNEQYKMSLVYGHCGGSLDAIGLLPTSYGIETPMLVSVKTAGAGARFKGMMEEGIKVKAPEYYDQECFYGYGYNIEYAAYIVTGKNDDNLHLEIEKLDMERGKQLVDKAEAIIFSKEPFEKISKSPSSGDCAGCTFKGICHKGEQVDKNCRSCKFSSPSTTPNADGSPVWDCSLYAPKIPDDVIKVGCGDWIPIINGK